MQTLGSPGVLDARIRDGITIEGGYKVPDKEALLPRGGIGTTPPLTGYLTLFDHFVIYAPYQYHYPYGPLLCHFCLLLVMGLLPSTFGFLYTSGYDPEL